MSRKATIRGAFPAVSALLSIVFLVAVPRAWADDTKVTIIVQGESPGDTTPTATKPPFAGVRAAVDVAILLDTSNSMDGLIDQAKKQLWTIVQQFAEARKAGQTPLLRVAVFEYGNSGLPASEGYIRQVVSLTDNLDQVSQGLFGLTTNGGDEYCGQVISEALQRLDWNNEPNNYRAIFIAGNEPFTQGSVNYQDACRQAIQTGVVVNTIHCGNYQAGVSGQWQSAAELAEGQYLNINQDKAVRHIICPQDKILIELNTKLNSTYLWFGSHQVRSYYCQNQLAQDDNSAEGVGLRCAIKATDAYSNVGRDLVDTITEDTGILEKLKKEELPDEMQSMSAEERQAHVLNLAQQRAKLKKQIAAVSGQRDAYLAEARQKLAEQDKEATLGDAVIAAVRQQLEALDFEVKPSP